MKKTTGMIFNIQHFCIGDGPGIRTTVFFKGCNLHCPWCHNPEGISPKQQFFWDGSHCVRCGRCIAVCPAGALYMGNDENIKKDEMKCLLCGKCYEICENEAIEPVGREYEVQELFDLLEKEKLYFTNSGGGVTASGGEALLQADFVRELFRKLKEAGISTALDTAACVNYAQLEKVLAYTDIVLLDLKIADERLHEEIVGKSNALILDNLQKMQMYPADIYIRIPVVGGINDNLDNFRKTAAFIKGKKNIKSVKLLPYHKLGIDKSKRLYGRDQKEFLVPDDELLAEACRVFKDNGICAGCED